MDSEASRVWLALGGTLQRAADDIGIGRTQKSPSTAGDGSRYEIDQFDNLVTSSSLRSASRDLFADGHYARAVEEAFKCLNNEVKDKAGLTSQDGASMMRSAFSPKKPALRLNPLATQSERDEQQGYMDMFAGVMSGIRNPRAHDHQLHDDPDVALEMIVFANHLMRKLDGAVKKP